LTEGQWREALDQAMTDLRAAEQVASDQHQLTEAGLRAAADFLGVRHAPDKLQWPALRARYLVPRLFGLKDLTEKEREKLAKPDNLRAILLARAFDLNVPKVPTLAQATEALVWKQLGRDDGKRLTVKAVTEVLLSPLLGLDTPLESKKLQARLPAHAIGASKSTAEGLRDQVVAAWLFEEPIVRNRPGPHDPAVGSRPKHEPAAEAEALDQFADRIRRLAGNSQGGRFGDDRVFVSHVWRQYQADASAPPLSFEQFKERLVEANRAELLRLARADLPEILPTDEVRASEIRLPYSEFHFVLL
jgi:hypothetical protein